VAKAIGSKHDEVIFTLGATLAINQIIAGHLSKDDHVVVDNRSHNSVLRTLFNLDGIDYSVATIYDQQENFCIDALLEQLRSNTRLLCLNHISNVTGSIYPIKYIVAELQRVRPDVAVFVDASQSAGILDLADELRGVDFFCFPGHKHLGSIAGAAAIVARKPLRPLYFGGTGRESAQFDANLILHPHEVGTPCLPAIAGMVSSLEDATKNLVGIRAHDTLLTERMWSILENIKEIELIGRPPGIDRIGVIAFAPLHGEPEIDWLPYLRMQGVIARGGLHCSPTIHLERGLGSGGTVRFSLGPSNNLSEVESVGRIVAEFAEFLSAQPLYAKSTARPVVL
jgi:selenocysteine lyase/cysteine desulfurase